MLKFNKNEQLPPIRNNILNTNSSKRKIVL